MKTFRNDASKILRKSLAIVLIPSLLVLITSLPILYARADSINPHVFAIDSKPYGVPYADWAGRWQQWLLTIPQPFNPVTDSVGKNCGQHQTGPVWFLPGTTGGQADRICTIPAGKAILFPVIGSECDFATYPNVKSESQLVLCAQADDNRAINLQATIDGVNIKQLDKYRSTSPLFNVSLPDKNVFGSPPGNTQGISDGFWVFLKPLPPGKHELHFSGLTPGNPTTGTVNFGVDVTYHLIIQ